MQSYIKNHVKIFVTIFSSFSPRSPSKEMRKKATKPKILLWKLLHAVYHSSCEYFSSSGISDDFAHLITKSNCIDYGGTK